jgi:DNA-directed RNA polymerase specialized sigma24 family protein
MFSSGFGKKRKRIEVSNVRGYLYVAVRNRAMDYRPSKRMIFCTLASAVHLPSESYTLHDILEYRELVKRVDTRISMLPKRCKMITNSVATRE